MNIREFEWEASLPIIIQGGMGVNVSSPQLANAVSSMSQPGRETLGTISGTAVERVMARMLQKWWPEAQEIIEALADFPFPEVSERVIKRYLNKPWTGIPIFTLTPSKPLIELVVCANYAFVKIAKKWHTNPVSINYLEKIQMPHLASIYGAMLADVDYVTMGAGIPLGIPTIFEAFSDGTAASYKISVIWSTEAHEMTFDPKKYFWENIPAVKKPNFIPIISTDVLANVLKTKLGVEKIYGFVIEAPSAGGHNAPPRNKTQLYGPKDAVNFEKMHDYWIPFWLAGSYASPEGLMKARELWATGIQAGSLFALTKESGMRPDLKAKIIHAGLKGTLKVRTDFSASPTGFPFKIAEIPGTMSEWIIHKTRKRICDECALRSPCITSEWDIGYRCSSEPIEDYVNKGGKIEDTEGSMCLCNGLMATAWVKDNEPPIVTLGDDTSFIKKLGSFEGFYSARDALNYLLNTRAKERNDDMFGRMMTTEERGKC